MSALPLCMLLPPREKMCIVQQHITTLGFEWFIHQNGLVKIDPYSSIPDGRVQGRDKVLTAAAYLPHRRLHNCQWRGAGAYNFLKLYNQLFLSLPIENNWLLSFGTKR